MPQFSLEFLPIVIGVVIEIVLGFVWYASATPTGKMWISLTGITDEKAKQMGGMGFAMAVMIAEAVLLSIGISHLINVFRVTSLINGLMVGFMMWLFFGVTNNLSVIGFEHRSKRLFALNQAYKLLVMLLMAAINIWF